MVNQTPAKKLSSRFLRTFATGAVLGIGIFAGNGATFLTSTLVSAAEKQSQPNMDHTLVTVGKTEIKVKELEDKVLEIPGIMRTNFETVDGKKKLLENLIKGELLYQSAKDAGYDKDPEIQAKVLDTIKSIYQSEYFKREVQNAVVKNEQQTRDYYDKNKEMFANPETRKVRHIQLLSKEKAVEVKGLLEKGADWAATAEKFTTDAATKSNGGNLGTLKAGGTIPSLGNEPNLVNAAFNAPARTVAGPVQSSKGWHLVWVDEINQKSYQAFDSVKTEIADQFLVTDADVQARYEQRKDEFTSREHIQLYHIQVVSKEKGEEVLGKLKNGEDWTTVCRLYSQDATTAAKGGDLGQIYRDSVIKNIGKEPQFEAAVFAMKNESGAKLLQAANGWHVVRVANYEAARQKSFEEVKPMIRNQLLRDARENLLEAEFNKMKTKYNVKVNESEIIDTSWRLKDLPPSPLNTGAAMPSLPGFGQ